MCPACHAIELTAETTSQCVECGLNVCRKCSTAIPSGKKHVWMCIRCAENYPQLSPGKAKVVVQEKAPQNSREGDQVRKQQESNQASNTTKHQGNIQQQNQTNVPAARGRSGSLSGPQDRPHDSPQQHQPPSTQQQQKQQPKHAQSKQHPQQVRPQHPPPQHPQQNVPQHSSPQHPQQSVPQHPPSQHPQQNVPQYPSPQHPQQSGPQHPSPQHPQQGTPHHPPSQHLQQGIPQQQTPQQGMPQQRPPFVQQQQHQQPSPPHPQQRPHMQQHPDQQFKLQQQRPYQQPPPPPQQQHLQQNRPQHPQQTPQHMQQTPQQTPQLPQQTPQHPQQTAQHPMQMQQQRPQQQHPQHHQQPPTPHSQKQHPQQPYSQQPPPNSQHHPQHQQQSHPQQNQQHPPHHQDFQTQQKTQHNQQHPQKNQQPTAEDFQQHISEQQHPSQMYPPNEPQHQTNQRTQQPRPQQQPQQRNHSQPSHGPATSETANAFQEATSSSMVRSKPQEPIAAQSLSQICKDNLKNESSPNDRPTNNVPRVGTNPFRPDPNPFRNSVNHEDVLQGMAPATLDSQSSDPFNAQTENNFNQGHLNGLDRNQKIKKVQGNEGKKEPGENVDHPSDVPPQTRQRRGSLTEMSRQAAEIEAEMRHKEEEQRKNAANICPPEPSSRRQLPVIDKNRQKKQLPELPQQQQNFPQPQSMIEDSQIPTTTTPPTPRARTSVQEKHGDVRNGQASIPRTVPLTAATLQQHQQQPPQLEQQAISVSPAGHVKQTQQLLQQQIQEQQQKQRLDRETDVYRSFGVIGQEQQHLGKQDPKFHQQQQKPETSRKERSENSRTSTTRQEKENLQRNEKSQFENKEEQFLQKYPDEEEDVDDYFKLIENAIGVRKPQVVLGANKFSDVQKQLLGQEHSKEPLKTQHDNYIQRKGHVANTARQMDMYNQNHSSEYNALSGKPTAQIVASPNKVKSSGSEGRGLRQDQQRLHSKDPRDNIDDLDDGYVQLKRDSQYIIPPASTEAYHQRSVHDPPRDGPTRPKITEGKNGKPYTGTPYDKLLMHQLTPDTRQPSAKHYLEEHKTQPVSYEAFSSAKAASQQTHRRSSEPLVQSNAYPHAGTEVQDEDSKRLMYSLGLINDSISSQKKTSSDPYFAQSGTTVGPVESKSTELSEATLNQQNLASGAKPNAIDIQNQKKAKTKPDPQDWSPVSDLSPIMDVSPSVEAAEQEMMEKFREKSVGDEYDDEDDDLLLDDKDSKMIKSTAGMQGGIPRATSGTISGMLEEFNRAMGLPGTSPVDDSGIKTAVSPTSLAISPISMTGSSVTSSAALQKEYQDTFPRVSADGSQKQQGSPQKTAPAPGSRDPQPTTPRRTHRRLPQPTVEQMQAAVAMAAQGPRDKAAATTAVILHQAGSTSLLPSATAAPVTARPVSPMVPWKSSDVNQAFDQAFSNQSQLQSLESTLEGTQNETSAVVPPKPYPRGVQTSGQSVGKYSENTEISSASLTSTPQNSSMLPQDTNNIQARRLRSSSYSSGGSSSDVKTGKSTDEVLMLRSASNGTGSPAFFNTAASSEKVATTEGSPQTPSTPRDKGGDSSDTQSEAESIKSVRLRRKLPSLPADQRSSPSPTRKNLERNKTPPSATEAQDIFLVDKPSSHQKYSTDATSVFDTIGSSQATLTNHDMELETKSISSAAIVTSKNNISLTELSVSGASSVRSLSPSRDTGSLSPSKKPHDSLTSPAHYSRTPSPSRADAVSPGGTKLPQYMQTLKQQLREELKQVTEERKVLMELRKDGHSPGHSATLPSIHRQQLQKRLDEDDITIMTTATSTVVSSTALPQSWNDSRSTLQLQQRATGLSSSSMHQITIPVTSTAQITSPQQAAGVALSGSLTPTAAALRRQQQLARASPQASPKKGRRRHTSEINVPQFSPMNEFYQQERVQLIPKQQPLHHPMYPGHQYHQARTIQMQQQPQQVLTPGGSYKTMEFGALDGYIRPAPGTMAALRSSNRYGGSLGSGLSQTDGVYFDRMGGMAQQQIPYYVTDNRQMEEQRIMGPDIYFQTLNNEINRLRRSSEAIHQDPIYGGGMSWAGGGGAPDIRMGTSSPQTTERRKKKKEKPRKPSRSWQPSPYVSEDEDDQLTREEKKAKIKAEIARRRQQIEENMRLHDELVKLARRRDRQETATPVGGSTGSSMHMGTYNKPSDLLYATTPRQTMEMNIGTPLRSSSSLGLNADASNDDTSSVLKAIDEILRKDLYSGGALARAAAGSWGQPYTPSAQEQQTLVMRGPGMYGPQTIPNVQTPSQGGMIGLQQINYYTVPRTRYEYTTPQEISPSEGYYNTQIIEERSPTRVSEMDQYYEQPVEETSAEDESIERIASTFPTDEPPDILLSATPGPQMQVMQTSGHFHADLSPITPTDVDMMHDHDATPAMPLLPDMPTRSRKLLENLGSSPIQASRSGSTQSIYQELLEGEQGHQEVADDQSMGHRPSEMQSTLIRPSRKSPRAHISKTAQKYNFPVKRILLTRDPKDRSVSGNGLGMKVVGGKEVPGSHGMIGAYVAKIFPGGVVETLGEVKEGDQVLEWNGISLTGRTYEEVQRIIASSADEVEIVIRCDLNMLEAVNHHRNKSPGLGMGGPRLDPPGTPGSNGRSGGNPSPGPHSPYSPAGSSPRGHSPAMNSKRMTGGSTGGGGGGMVTHNDNQHHLNLQQHLEMTHSALSGSSLSNSASSYDNPLSPDRYQSDRNVVEYAFIGADNNGPFPHMNPERPTGVVTLFTSSAGLLHHTFSTTSEWPDIYDSPYHQSSPDEYVQLRDDREVVGRQVQVACGPRAAIMYVPIIPMQPLVAVKNNGYITQPITERASFARRSLDHIPDYGSLIKAGHPLWPGSEVLPIGSRRPLGVEVLNYELLQAKSKVSLHLNGLKENALADFPSLTKLNGKNGIRHVNEVEEIEARRGEDGSHRPSISSTGERPRAPQDLPGLRPIFVNDWKRTKKTKGEENDDNNNNSSNNNNNEAGAKKNGNGNKPSHVGSSPEASPYNFLPKGCRGSFCVIL